MTTNTTTGDDLSHNGSAPPGNGLRFTTSQVQQAVRRYANTTISGERLRQFRKGGEERRKRRYGTYKHPYPPELLQGTDWRYEAGHVIFTLPGLRKILHRYGVELSIAQMQEIASWPPNKWLARKMTQARTTPPSAPLGGSASAKKPPPRTLL